jgi:hypothetical protein
MLQTLMPIILALSWLALPVTLACILDDWFLRPRRALASTEQPPRDPPLCCVSCWPSGSTSARCCSGLR